MSVEAAGSGLATGLRVGEARGAWLLTGEPSCREQKAGWCGHGERGL